MKKWMIMLVAIACLCGLLLTACGGNDVEEPTDSVDSSTGTTTVQPSNTAEGDSTGTPTQEGGSATGEPSADPATPGGDEEEVTGYAYDDYSKNY